MSILDRFRLDHRVAVVTDASSEQGVAFAKALAEAGADVVLAAQLETTAECAADTVRGIGRRALAVATDITDPEQCTRLVDATLAKFGRVDILINNARSTAVGPAISEPADRFRSTIDIDLYGSYWSAQACARVMQPGSSIVNIAGISGLTTTGVSHAAVSAGKAAVIGLTRDLAQQWGSRKGIRVNAIAPGFFGSDATAEHSDGFGGAQASRVVLGRTGDFDELAATVVWLASDAGGYVTGQTVTVDGGFTIT